MNPAIFISHRSTDAEITEILLDYLVSTGIPQDSVFISSLPGNDVKHIISKEIKNALNTSLVNIVILSEAYYESAYCLNEAGIIWFQEDTPAIVIGLPDITPENMKGFLNNDYKIRHLDNQDDISHIYDTVRSAVGATPVSMTTALSANKKFIDRYTACISKFGL